jgi:hypothetical protein
VGGDGNWRRTQTKIAGCMSAEEFGRLNGVDFGEERKPISDQIWGKKNNSVFSACLAPPPRFFKSFGRNFFDGHHDFLLNQAHNKILQVS